MADEEGKREGRGFTVTDRRRFSAEADAAREEPQSGTEAASDSSQQCEEKPSPGATQQEALPEINFSTFVISLSTQALMHLGEMANPLSGKIETELPVAKQMIDILAMLKDKTRGNLNASEDRLMEDVLFDLRMKYVEAVKKK